MTTERRISLKADVQGADQVTGLQKALEGVKGQSADAQRGLWQIGDALTQRTIPPLQDYKKLWDSSGQAVVAFGGMAVGALGKLTQEFQKQKTLGEFYGTGTIKTSILSLNSATREYLSGGGRGFTSWIDGASSKLVQYRMVLAGAAAGMAAFGAAAAFSAKGTANLIDSTMQAHRYRISDEEKTRSWLESALTTDWSGGRSERAGIYDAIMSKRIMNEGTAIKSTETIEKFFFANMERLKKMGIGSSEQLAEIMTSEGSSEEQLRQITGKYGMDKMTAVSRLNVMKSLTDDYDMDKEIDKRPEEVLKKRLEHTTTNIGKTLIPVLNTILGAFLKLSEVLGKIPGASKIAGWGIVFVGVAATLGLILPLLGNMLTVFKLMVPAIRLIGITMNTAILSTGVGAILIAVGLLAVFLYKTGMLQKAWDKFKGSNIGAGLANGLAAAGEYAEKLAGFVGSAFDRLDKAYASGSITGGIKTILEFSSPMFKIFQFIGEHVKRLVDKTDSLQKLAKVGSVIMQAIHGFIEKLLGIVSAVRDGISNLLSQIPGAKKREAVAELEEEAARRGLKYKDGQFYNWDEKTLATNVPAHLTQKAAEVEEMPGFFGDLINSLKMLIPGAKKEQLREAWMATVPEGWEYDASTKRYYDTTYSGNTSKLFKGKGYGSTGISLEDFNKLVPEVGAAYHAYELEPGVAQGIADAVTQALDRWSPDFDFDIPGLDSLEEALTNLNGWLEEHGLTVPGLGLGDPDTGKSGTKYSGWNRTGTNTVTSDTGTKYERINGRVYEIGSWGAKTEVTDSAVVGTVTDLVKADVGGQILSSGPLIGHEGEEIVPASVRRGGETALEKILNYGSSSAPGASGSPIYLNAHVTNNINRIDSDVDFQKMMDQSADRFIFAARNKLENLNVRGIGYLRG